jgi:16S rRNA (cytidine1402-2'-O)-methyltransferase
LGLTFVPTPLGNLRDVTLRALDVLGACDLIVAEDTRVARRLLNALALPAKPIWSYREQNAAAATGPILERARLDLVAVVTDAGMPGISDPGRELVAAARSAGVAVDVLPGPCAFVCAAVLSGFDIRRLAGFVPRARGERERAFMAALAGGPTTAFYEAPSRIVATLEHLAQLAPAASVFVGRELTKRFEQQICGTPATVLAALERPVRGELVLVLAPGTAETDVAPPASAIDAAIDAQLAAGASPSRAAKALAALGLGDRATLYRRIAERKAAGPRPSTRSA